MDQQSDVDRPDPAGPRPWHLWLWVIGGLLAAGQLAGMIVAAADYQRQGSSVPVARVTAAPAARAGRLAAASPAEAATSVPPAVAAAGTTVASVQAGAQPMPVQSVTMSPSVTSPIAGAGGVLQPSATLSPTRPGAEVAAVAPSAPATYLVQAGDGLDRVADRVGVSPAALAAANGLAPLAWLTVGQVLRIPSASSPVLPGK